MNSIIREYRDQDLESSKKLWNELTQRHRDIYFDPSIGGEDPGSAFEDFLQKTNLAGLWVVEQDGLVLGMAGLLMNGTDAEIEPIVIHSQFRSKGIGTLLIERLKSEARERGVVYLSIRPVARNVEAIRCFHRAGFALLGHIDMFLDLTTGGNPEEWKEGVTIHEQVFRY